MEKAKLYDIGIIALNDKVIIVSKMLNKEENLYYSNIFTSNIENKQELLNMMSGSNNIYVYMLFFATIFIYMFAVYFASNLVDAMVLGALGYIFARIVKLRLKFKATFNMGVYALTLPILLNLVYIVVNTFTGFKINYFQWMYTTISYIYVAVAILMIKTELINQKIQLIKIKQIQEEVAKEREEEERQKENNREEKKEKEKEEKEDKKQSGEEPEGSNA